MAVHTDRPEIRGEARRRRTHRADLVRWPLRARAPSPFNKVALLLRGPLVFRRPIRRLFQRTKLSLYLILCLRRLPYPPHVLLMRLACGLLVIIERHM